VIPLLKITMDTAQHPHLAEVDWLAASFIGPYAVAYRRWLMQRRYAAHTIASYIAEVTHFACWIRTRRLPLARPVRQDDLFRIYSMSSRSPAWRC